MTSFTMYFNTSITSAVFIFLQSWPFIASCQLWHRTCAHMKLRPCILTDQRQCTILKEIKSLIYMAWLYGFFIIINTVRTGYTMIAGWGCHAGILQLFSLEGVDTSGSKVRTTKSHYCMSMINTMLTIQVNGAQKHKSWAEELLPSTPWESRWGSPFAIPAWFLTATETKFRPSYIKKY